MSPRVAVGPLDPALVRDNVERVRERIAAAAARAGRADAEQIELCAAVKYVAAADMDALAQAGVKLVGENRAQDLEAKATRAPGAFTWDFIGHLQSRKVKLVLPHVRLIHSVASESVLAQLERHADPSTQVLVEVNTSGEPSKSGVAPGDLDGFVERCPVTVAGLMTMPPYASEPEASRPHFAALRELAREHGLHHLSMGTSQDYAVAAAEGATIVRVGSLLYA